jgi:hypothetical protein
MLLIKLQRVLLLYIKALILLIYVPRYNPTSGVKTAEAATALVPLLDATEERRSRYSWRKLGPKNAALLIPPQPLLTTFLLLLPPNVLLAGATHSN